MAYNLSLYLALQTLKTKKMKKVFLAAVVAALTTLSCTKDRTCNCSVTNELAGSSTASSDNFTIKDATKGQAKAQCVSTVRTYTVGTNTATETRNCELK
jgi:hypothetical protein